MSTLFTVGIEVQTSAAQQAIARMERAFDQFARSSQSATRATKEFDRELDSATEEVNKLADEMERANKRQQDFERGSTAVALALGAATIKIKQYLSGLTQLGQQTQAAIAANSTLAEDANEVDKAFRQLTKELNYSTNSLELNKAAYDVFSAGVSKTADVMNVMRAGVAGAKGGFSDLGTVTDALTTIMNAYNKSSSEAQRIVDMMITTQNDGKIVVAQYGQQIGVVASAAASAGVTLEELNAAVALATVSGVQVSSTFSGLRQAISSVASPSEQAKKMAKELGIEFSQQAIKSRGFAQVLTDVAKATKGNAEQIAKLFDSVEARAVIDPILNNLGRYTKMLDNQQVVAGASTEAQQKLAGGLMAAQAAFANVRVEVERDIFSTLEPVITAITNATTGLAKAFVSLPEPIQAVAIGIGVLGAAVVGTTAAMLAFKAMGLTTALVSGTLSAAMGVILHPIGLLAIAAGAVYLAFQQMMKSSEKLRKVMGDALPRIGKVANQVFGGIGRMVDVLTGKYASHEKESQNIFKRMGDWFAEFVDNTVRGWEMIGAAFDRYAITMEKRAGVGTVKGLSLTEVERGIQAGNVGNGMSVMLRLTMESRKLEEDIARMETEAKRFRTTGMGVPNVKLEEDIKKRKQDFAEMTAAYNRLGNAINNYNKKRAEAAKPEEQANSQQAIAAGLEEQVKALESQLPKQRALADLEITRLQQRLDLEKAYGKISQEEILRRETAIRLRRNELALANLSLEKAEQEQRIKNGENVERRDFSTEEQRIREDSLFVQQKLEAELSRMKIEAEEKREQQRQQSERELFDMRANFEARMLDLQLQNAEIVRQRQMEGRNEVERAVISELNKFYGLAADQQRQQQQYESDYQRLVNDRNILQNRQNQLRKEAQKNNDEFESILQRYPSTIVNGIPTFEEGTVFSVNDNERLDALESRNFSIRDEFEQLNSSIAKLNLQIQQLSQLEAQRLENANEKYQNATKNWQNLFIGRIHEMYESAKAENDRIALQLRVDNAPMGKQPYMKAGLSVEEVYGSVKNKLRDGLAIAVESGNNDLAAMYKQQLELFDRLQESGDIELLETGLIKLEEARAIADREAERTQFQSSLKDMAQAEVNRTKSLQDQLLLMSLQGDEKEKAIARIRAEEVIEQRRRKLMEQMEGAPQDSTYYAYMVKELETLEAHLATLTDVFYQQGTAQSQLVKQTELFNEQLRMTQAIADGLGNSFANAFGEFVMGTKTAQQAFADMMGSMANVFMQEFQRMVSQKAAAGLFGLLGNLFGLNQQSPVSGVGQFNFGGGVTSPSFNAANVVGFDDLAPRFVPFAEGGIVSKPTLGLVGETGREAIIPLDKLDNMKSNVSIVVNVANDGNNTVDRQGGNQLGRELETAVMAVIQKQKRPGGLLASVR